MWGFVKLGRNDVYSDYKELKFWVRLKCSLYLRYILLIEITGSSSKAQGVNLASLVLFKFPHNPAFFLHNQHISLHNIQENFHIIFIFFPHPIRCSEKTLNKDALKKTKLKVAPSSLNIWIFNIQSQLHQQS